MIDDMIKTLSHAALLALILALPLCGCQKVEQVAGQASEALAHGNYKKTLKILLELPDRTIVENDSLLLMLSEAYYRLNGKFAYINGTAICDIDFTPDGKRVLFTDLQTPQINEYSYPELELQRIIGTNSPVYAIDISPDGKQFAAALHNSDVVVFDYASGTPVNTLSGHTSRVRAVAYLDSTYLVSGSNDKSLITWDLAQGAKLDQQRLHRKNVKSVKRSLDGRYIVSTSNDGTAVIWDYSDKSRGKEYRKVVHGKNYVNDGALSPDNRWLVTVSGDGDAKVWHVATGALKQIIPLDDFGCSVEFSPDGSHVAVGGCSYMHIIDADTWTVEERVPVMNDAIWSVKFPADDRLVFADSRHYYEIQLLSPRALIDASRTYLKNNNLDFD